MSLRIALFVLLLGLAGTGSVVAADLGSLLTSRLPAGWRPAPKAEIPRRFTNGPATLVIVDMPTTDGPATFAQHNLADLQRLLDGFEVTSFEFTFPLGGRSWSRIRYKLRLSEKRREQELWTTTDGTTGWCVTIADDQHLDATSGFVRQLLAR